MPLHGVHHVAAMVAMEVMAVTQLAMVHIRATDPAMEEAMELILTVVTTHTIHTQLTTLMVHGVAMATALAGAILGEEAVGEIHGAAADGEAAAAGIMVAVVIITTIVIMAMTTATTEKAIVNSEINP